MLEELQRRNFAATTIRTYLYAQTPARLIGNHPASLRLSAASARQDLEV
jgi:hypothetical protein